MPQAFTIRRATQSRTAQVLDFHRQHLSRYLWPRDQAFFDGLAEAERLFEVVTASQDIVGMCYVVEQDAPAPYEFGCVFVLPEYRGCGLAFALGVLAISSTFLWDPPETLIAHVHEANPDPRPLLEKRLGFFDTQHPETVPLEFAPPGMATNQDGRVVGDVFQFRTETLADFATWLESYNNLLPKGDTLHIDLAFMTDPDQRPLAIRALRDMAQRRP